MSYFAENVVVFDLNAFQREFTLLEYLILFIGIVVIVGYYLYIEQKYNHFRHNWFFIFLLFVIAIGALIGVFLTPEIQYFDAFEMVGGVETIVTKEYVTTAIDKIKSSLFIIVSAIGVYTLVIVMPRLICFRKYILFIMYVIVAVALVSAFVSYFVDYESYVHLYRYGLVGYIYPQSFVFNRNMYALILLLGILALYAIISHLPKWYNYVFLIFLFVNIFFTFSKAAFGIAFITFCIHFIYRMIATFKKSKVRNIIFLVIVGIVGICGMLLIPFPLFMNVQLFDKARRFILEYYVELGIGSYDGRTEIWNSVLSLSTGIHLWFGRGLLIFNNALFFYSGQIALPNRLALFSHNGFLEILGQWGLVGLIPYCVAILAIFGIDIYAAIKNYKIGIPALIIFGAFLGYTMVETSTLFDMTIEGVTTTLLVTLPVLSWLYAKRHPEENRTIVKSAENIVYQMPNLDSKVFGRRVTCYVGLILGIYTLFAFYSLFLRSDTVITDYVLQIVLILISFVCLPRTIINIHDLKRNKKPVLFWISLTIILLLAIGSFALIIIMVDSVVVFLFTIKLMIVSLLISERFFKLEKAPFKDYLVVLLGKASVLYFSIVVSGLLVVFLYPGLTRFVLSEIAAIISIISLPIINPTKIENNRCNSKLLISFARSIEQ
ncbi:MAG: O-antigen ligase family protein [Bacilli bacterium]|nr:O-antigen ligase family protein [Bacilli bacterium]